MGESLLVRLSTRSDSRTTACSARQMGAAQPATVELSWRTSHDEPTQHARFCLTHAHQASDRPHPTVITPIEDHHLDAEFGSMPSPCAVLRLDEIAETYPDIPLMTIVQCLINVDRRTEHMTEQHSRNDLATRLTTAALDALAAQRHAR